MSEFARHVYVPGKASIQIYPDGRNFQSGCELTPKTFGKLQKVAGVTDDGQAEQFNVTRSEMREIRSPGLRLAISSGVICYRQK